jgi:hypothetical protein
MLPPLSLSISDSSAVGYVINSTTFHQTSPLTVDSAVDCSSFHYTTFVYLSYTDKDVDISGTGLYTGPYESAQGTCVMNLSLKAGWNRVVMTRTGSSSYTDTFSVGEAPSDTCWWYAPG